MLRSLSVRQPSIPDVDSIPPPSGTTVEERLAWCVDVLQRGPYRHLPARVTALEESLGVEGNDAKGREATGLHLALEKLDKKVEEELGRVLAAVEDLGKALEADRAAKATKAAEDAALERERAPRQKDISTARTALVATLVGMALTALGAVVARHWRW